MVVFVAERPEFYRAHYRLDLGVGGTLTFHLLLLSWDVRTLSLLHRLSGLYLASENSEPLGHPRRGESGGTQWTRWIGWWQP